MPKRDFYLSDERPYIVSFFTSLVPHIPFQLYIRIFSVKGISDVFL